MSENDTVPSQSSDISHALSCPRQCYKILLIAESDEDSLSVRYFSRQIAAIE